MEIKKQHMSESPPLWMTDYAFWQIYQKKSRDYSLGPLAIRPNTHTNLELETNWKNNSAAIYEKYKHKEDTIPIRFQRCGNRL